MWPSPIRQEGVGHGELVDSAHRPRRLASWLANSSIWTASSSFTHCLVLKPAVVGNCL